MNILRHLVFLSSLFFAPWSMADEIRIFAAGAAKHAVESITSAFFKATGHSLHTSYDTVGALRDRVLQAPAGQVADVVILSNAALATLRTAGRLSPTPARSVGYVVVAVAVHKSTLAPDLSNAAALRQALLATPSLAYGDPARGATAGTHFAKVIDAMGLREALHEKITVLPFGVDVITGVAEGRYALGISQSSEIMQHTGVRYAGALPAPHDLSTGYGAALSSQSEAARQFLFFLGTDPALREFASSGFVATP